MSQKRELLINTALDLFYRNGINSIGINEVLKISGVAKRTLYSHFNGKDELILAALEKRHSAFLEWLKQSLSQTHSDQDVISHLFLSLRSWFRDKEPELGPFRGCFFINTAAEFADKNSTIFQFCIQHKINIKQLIESKLSLQNKELADTIYLMQEGVITSSYMAGQSDDLIDVCIDSLTAQLK